MRTFRSLMPRDDRFIGRFCEHANLIVPAAEEFRALMSDDSQAERHAAEISRLEEAADRITRETVLAIHRTFVTPFDRSQIMDLITALDDTIDYLSSMRDYQRMLIRGALEARGGLSSTTLVRGWKIGLRARNLHVCQCHHAAVNVCPTAAAGDPITMTTITDGLQLYIERPDALNKYPMLAFGVCADANRDNIAAGRPAPTEPALPAAA